MPTGTSAVRNGLPPAGGACRRRLYRPGTGAAPGGAPLTAGSVAVQRVAESGAGDSQAVTSVSVMAGYGPVSISRAAGADVRLSPISTTAPPAATVAGSWTNVTV